VGAETGKGQQATLSEPCIEKKENTTTFRGDVSLGDQREKEREKSFAECPLQKRESQPETFRPKRLSTKHRGGNPGKKLYYEKNILRGHRNLGVLVVDVQSLLVGKRSSDEGRNSRGSHTGIW